MKYEDYEKRLTNLVKDVGGQSAEEVLDILKEIKADTDAIASYEAIVKDKDTKIADLNQTNMNLFMRITGGTDEQDPPEKTPDEMINDLFKEE